MSAVFDYISGTKDGEEARLAAISEYTAAHLGTALTENEQLRAEIASLRDTLKLKESELAALDKSHADLGHRLADMGRREASLRAALELWRAAWKAWGSDPTRSDSFDEAWGTTSRIFEQSLSGEQK